MARFLGRRLIRAVLTVWAVATLVFLLMHALPGDVVLVLLDTVGAGSPAAEKMRQFLGLDRPLHVQYFDWLGDILRGDMGNSLLGGYPVWDLVKSRIPVTVELAALTILLGLSIAIPLGILAAARNGTWVDLLAMQFGQLGISIPNFWIATILILVVAARLQWLPPSGYKPFSDGLGVNLLHMVMPTVSLALPLAAVMTRVVRSAVLEVLSRDYMRVAHAKGLRPTASTLAAWSQECRDSNCNRHRPGVGLSAGRDGPDRGDVLRAGTGSADGARSVEPGPACASGCIASLLDCIRVRQSCCGPALWPTRSANSLPVARKRSGHLRRENRCNVSCAVQAVTVCSWSALSSPSH